MEPAQLAAQFENLEQKVNNNELISVQPTVVTESKTTDQGSVMQVDNTQQNPPVLQVADMNQAPMYLISEQPTAETRQVVPIPLFIVQQPEQPSVLEAKEQQQEQNFQQDDKSSVLYYMPMQNLLQNELHYNHPEAPQQYVEIPIQVEQTQHIFEEQKAEGNPETQNEPNDQLQDIQKNKSVVETQQLSKEQTESNNGQVVVLNQAAQPIALPYVYEQIKEQTNDTAEEVSRIKQLLNQEKLTKVETNSVVDSDNLKYVTLQQEEQKYDQIQITPTPQIDDKVKYYVKTKSDYEQTQKSVTINYETQTNTEKTTEESVDSIYTLEQLSGYGTKLNSQQQEKPQASKLISSTKNMVNGEDVLNINAIQFGGIESTSSTANVITAQNIPDTFTSIDSSYIHETDQAKLSAYVSTTTAPVEVTEYEELKSLSKQPIVVEDESNDEQSVEVVTSTTETALRKDNEHDTNLENTVIVTPRPVSTQFLAPITAGVQLQSLEYTPQNHKENIYVEIQKSVPYYLGKLEYLQSDDTKHAEDNHSASSISKSALDNLQVGNVLLRHNHEDVKNRFFEKALEENCTEPYQEQLSGEEKEIIAAVANKEVSQTSNQHYYLAMPPEQENKEVDSSEPVSEQHVQIPVPVLEPNTKTHAQIIEKPVHITQYVDRPYPVPVPVQVHVPVPYTVEKQVPVPVTVEKIVDRPVTVTKYVERPVHIPQPYVVEKVVEKHVEVPVEVTKYIDRPYPVQVSVPHPVPFPVEVALPPPIPTDTPYVNKQVVEKSEKPQRLVYGIPRPNNQHFHGKPSSLYTQQPVQVEEISKYIDKVVNKPFPVYYLNDNHVQETSYPTQYMYAPHYHPNVQCDQEASHSTKLYQTINPDDYIGMVPPKPPSVRPEEGRVRQNRHARHEFGKNLRIEYGFMPPLIPSLEIDENGQPVERKE